MKKKWTVGEIQSLSIVTGDPFHYTGKWEKRFDPGMQAAKADWPMMQFLQNRKSNVIIHRSAKCKSCLISCFVYLNHCSICLIRYEQGQHQKFVNRRWTPQQGVSKSFINEHYWQEQE